MKNFVTPILILFVAGMFPVKAFCGLATKGELWSKQEITVCWAAGGEKFHNCDGEVVSVKFDTVSPQSPALRRYRDLIQNIISAEYRVHRVGISFVGWNDCPSEKDVGDNKVDLIITLRSETVKGTVSRPASGIAELGACKQDIDFPKRVSTIGLTVSEGGAWPYKIDMSHSLQLTALHEFGHAAGLMHEDYIIGESKQSLREMGGG